MNAPVRLVVGELEGVACSRTMTEEDVAMLESIVARTLTGAELLRGAAVLERVRKDAALVVTKDWDAPGPDPTLKQELEHVYFAARHRGLSGDRFLAWVAETIAHDDEARRRNAPSVPDVEPLVQAFHARDAAGCCLHIVLADGNVDDASVDFCIAEAVRCAHEECRALASLLRTMSRTQRGKLAARWGESS